MPPVAIAPQRMEALARVLRLAGQRAMLEPDRLAEIHGAFTAADSQGVWWTVGLESSRWNRLDGSTWTAGEPPRELFLDSEVRATLEGLEAALERTTPTPPAESTPARGPEAGSGSTGHVSPYAPPGYVSSGARESAPTGASAPAAPPAPSQTQASGVAGAGDAMRSNRTTARDDSARTTPPRATTATAPARTRARLEDDWSHVVLCIALAASFVTLAYWKNDPRAFAAAGLFGLLVVILTVVNLAQSRH
jgi:hypothetical protein